MTSRGVPTRHRRTVHSPGAAEKVLESARAGLSDETPVTGAWRKRPGGLENRELEMAGTEHHMPRVAAS